MSEDLQLKRQWVLYEARCLRNGKSYVGQTRSGLAQRWRGHVSEALRQPHRGCSALHGAIRAYGREAFELTVLATADTLEEANRLEAELIAERGTLTPNGYNLDVGGNAAPRTALTIAKISASQTGVPKLKLRGRKRDPEIARKAAQTRLKNGTRLGPKVGHTISEETRRKIGDANRGTKHGPMCPEHKDKIRTALIGRSFSTDTIEKMRVAARKRVARKRETADV